MAEPFVRVDLSQSARDFQRIAMGPAAPMLDRHNANYEILRSWLKDFVAEPVIDEHGVGFQIPLLGDGTIGGRKGERPIAKCLPVSPRDLERDLAKPLQELRSRIGQVKPTTPTQQALHKALTESLKTQLSPENPYPGCNLFKYQGDDRRWRLLWCWGYHRKPSTVGAPVVRDGRLLLGEDVAAGPPPKHRKRLALAVVTVMLLLLLGGAGYVALQRGWLRGPVVAGDKPTPAATLCLRRPPGSPIRSSQGCRLPSS